MKILFVSRWFPFPPNNGSKLRIHNLLRGLAAEHAVTLLSFGDAPLDAPARAALPAWARDATVVPWKPYDAGSRRARLSFLSPVPRSFADTYSPDMQRRIEEALGAGVDLVIATQLGAAAYGPLFQGVPAILDEVELAVLHERYANATSLKSRMRHGLTWAKHRRYVSWLLRYFRACTVASEQELRLLRRIAPGYAAAEVVPNGIHLGDYQGFQAEPKAGSMIFTGSFSFQANYEAMVWFAQEVLPILQRLAPQARLTITGDPAGRALPRNPRVTIAGYVDDVRPWIASSWLSLAPLRSGGGTRLKILEAMALGTPVVATSKGAEGLDVVDGREALIADAPSAFAGAAARLLGDPALRASLAARAADLVRRRYDWAVMMRQYDRLIRQVVDG
jgi:glycosyltransferase involved in cell wall biosynthesis